MKKRLLSVLLCLAMLLSLLPTTAFAEETAAEEAPAASIETTDEETAAPVEETAPVETEEAPADIAEVGEDPMLPAEEAEPASEAPAEPEAPAAPEEPAAPEAPAAVEEDTMLDTLDAIENEPLDADIGEVIASGTLLNHVTWKLQTNDSENHTTLILTPPAENTPLKMDNAFTPPWYNYRNKITSIVFNETPGSKTFSTIGNYSFIRMPLLTSVEIPSGVKQIGDCAFQYCESLSSVTLPSGLEAINYAAFSCTALSSVTLPSGLKTIKDQAFANTKLTTIDIPASVTSISGGAFGITWNKGTTKMTSITVAEDNPNYVVSDGILYTKDMKTLVFCPEGRSTAVTIPDSVTTIDAYAFSRCDSIPSFTFSSNLKEIGNNAFEQTFTKGSTSLNLPDGVTTIGQYAFAYAPGIVSITLPSSITSIGKDALSGNSCASITWPDQVTEIPEGCLADSSLTSFVVPNGVSAIADNAFLNSTKLTTVTIPYSVESFGANVFQGCSKLSTITYTGTQDMWESLIAGVSETDEIKAATIDFQPAVLTGTFTLTSSVRLNTKISFGLTGGIKELYDQGQLQITWYAHESGSSVEYDVTTIPNYGSISDGRLTPGSGLLGMVIRACATSPNHLGSVATNYYTVGKAAAPEEVVPIQATYNSGSKSVLVTVVREESIAQEYLLLPGSTTLTDADWQYAVKGDAAGDDQVIAFAATCGDIPEALTANTRYILYSRYAETDTMSAARYYSTREVYTGTTVDLNEGSLLLNGLKNGERLYIDIDKLSSATITLPITLLNPDCNAWRAHSWTSASTSLLDVTNLASKTNASMAYANGGGSYPSSVTLEVKGTGYSTIRVGNDSGTTYASWPVQIYSSSSISVSQISVTPNSVDPIIMAAGDAFNATEELNLKMVPAIADASRFQFRWYECYYKANQYGDPIYRDTNDEYDFISVDPETGIITALNPTSENPSSNYDYAYVKLFIYDTTTGQESSVLNFKVTVTETVFSVDSLSLNRTTANINPNSTLQLYATISPYAASATPITWSSSDPSVASVSDTGLVTAYTSGDAVITASAGGKTASCAIHIKESHSISVSGGTAYVHGAPADTTLEGNLVTIVADHSENFVKWALPADIDADCTKSPVTFVMGTRDVSICAKYLQTVTAPAKITKTLGDAAFYMGAATDGDGALKYANGDKTVAAITSAGKITIKGVGSTVLKVKALDGVSSAATDWVNVTITVNPKAPSAAPTLTNAATGVKIAWPGVDGATGYQIYRKASGTSSYTKVATVKGAAATTWTDSTATTGTTYAYKIRAYVALNGTNYYSAYTAAASVRAIPVTTITAVTKASSTSIKLTWRKTKDAVGYQIYRKAPGESSYTKLKTITSGATLTYTNSKLTAGTYGYKIRPYFDTGSGRVYGAFTSVSALKLK